MNIFVKARRSNTGAYNFPVKDDLPGHLCGLDKYKITKRVVGIRLTGRPTDGSIAVRFTWVSIFPEDQVFSTHMHSKMGKEYIWSTTAKFLKNQGIEENKRYYLQLKE